ncbi:MAG: transporter ATP-binding protein, partial [Chloroflexota bacterium]|nr:transporter ATP-binding protein [Chloroflexota bacterium]
MSFSIGGAGARMGPGNALERFGDRTDGGAFDGRVALRLFAFVRPYWPQMAG